MSGYEYTVEDRIAQPHRYRFSPWGDEIVAAWWQDRDRIIARLGGPPLPVSEAVRRLAGQCQSAELLAAVVEPLLGGADAQALAVLPRWIHKWEVAKRFVTSYDASLRPASEQDRVGAPYLLFAAACVAAARCGGGLRALNAALKVCDTASSVAALFEAPEERAVLHWVLLSERELCEGVLRGERLPGRPGGAAASLDLSAPGPADGPQPPESVPVRRLAMLLLHNRRSQAYLQGLLANGLVPGGFVLLDVDGPGSYAASAPETDRFDTGEDVTATLQRHGLAWETVRATNANDPAVVSAVAALDQDFVVYCGGGILREPVLAQGKSFIHVHPGSLPGYRGSTCFYYQLIEERRCAATAFLMDTGLDTGALLAQRTFAPMHGEDLDEIFDPWMRAQVLVEVVSRLAREGDLVSVPQPSGAGDAYYVIHPVLKTAAMRGLR